MKVSVFRGVNTSDLDATERSLRAGSLNRDGRDWMLTDLRKHYASLLKTPGSWDEVRKTALQVPISFACGDLGGAAFYACRESKLPLVVELQVEETALIVDCRDFLCTVLQLGTSATDDVRAVRREKLSELYGSGVTPYFDAASQVTNSWGRIALCNAAAHDPAVVHGHLQNAQVLKGRYGVTFRSAFALLLPVAPADIVAIHRVQLRDHIEVPHVTLDQLVR